MTDERWNDFIRAHPVYEPRSFLDLPSDPEVRAIYDENMRVIEAAQREGERAWTEFVDWGRRPWWRRWLRRP